MYTIGELVEKLNLNKETIRYYEKIGLLNEAKRDEHGYRVYTEEDVEKIRFILIVKGFGFSLKEIGSILSKLYVEIKERDTEEIKKIVASKIEETNYKIEQLKETRRLLIRVDEVLAKNECILNTDIIRSK